MLRTCLAALAVGFICTGCSSAPDDSPNPSASTVRHAAYVSEGGHAIQPAPKNIKVTEQQKRGLAVLNQNVKPKAELMFYEMSGQSYDASRDLERFTYDINLKNKSSSQLSEVSVAFQIKSARTGQEIYRSEPQKVTQFLSDRVENKGPLEAFSWMAEPVSLTFSFPARLWTTDSDLRIIVVGVKGISDEHDLHDFGNLISFIGWNPEEEIEAAFLKDPSLFKTHNSVGTNPAMIAAAEGTPALVDFMLKHGVPMHATGYMGKDLLGFAIREDDPEMVAHVVKLGFPVNEKLKGNVTPLMYAVSGVCPRSVKWLLAHGADPNAVNVNNGTPLTLSIRNPNIEEEEIFDQLVAAKANIHYRSLGTGRSILDDTIVHGDVEALHKLVALGVDVNEKEPGTGITPLMLAAGGEYEMAKFLISKGADLKAVDSKGLSVFDYAKMSNTLHTDRFFREGIGM